MSCAVKWQNLSFFHKRNTLVKVNGNVHNRLYTSWCNFKGYKLKCDFCIWAVVLNLCFSSFADLVQCTHEPNVSIPQLANLLIERTTHANWVVVFKSLVSIHHMMNYGNEVSTISKVLI